MLVISCLYTYSIGGGGGYPRGPQLCSQPEVSEASAATAAVTWTPPVGAKRKVHRPDS